MINQQTLGEVFHPFACCETILDVRAEGVCVFSVSVDYLHVYIARSRPLGGYSLSLYNIYVYVLLIYLVI